MHTLDNPLRINSPLRGTHGAGLRRVLQFSQRNDVQHRGAAGLRILRGGQHALWQFEFRQCLLSGEAGAWRWLIRAFAASSRSRLAAGTCTRISTAPANPSKGRIWAYATLCPSFDNGVGALLGDLQSSGLLKQTLVVMAGEFGRTVGSP